MKGRQIALRAVLGLLVVAALGWFAYANAGQSVDLDFGLFTLRGVALSSAIYAAIIVGMLLMLAVGLRNDLRTRQALRRYEQIAGDLHGGLESEEERAGEESRVSL